MEMATTKYRLIFLPDDLFVKIMSTLPMSNLSRHEELAKSGIENFHLNESAVIFIPDRHREALHSKARKGEAV